MQCSTGDTSNDPSNVYLNANCICQILDTCNTDGQLTIYLNISKQTLVSQYTTGLRAALASMDNTCGALPFGPAPNNYSLGRRCSSDSDCQFPKCVPGSTCFCCANMNVLCSTNSDCQEYEKDSYCGCVLGGTGICGPYSNVLTGQPVLYDIYIGSYPPTIQV